MLKKIFVLPLIGSLTSLSAIAGSMGPETQSAMPCFYAGGFGGYGVIDGAYKQDGQFSQARLTMGAQMAASDEILLGLELGVQTGNSMRLKASSAVIDATGGLPVQSNLKPLVDLLATFKTQIMPEMPVSVIVKGGIAYRQLQLEDRSSNRDGLRKVNGEFQAGLGYNITEHAMLTAYYQGIYNKSNANVTINNVGDTIFSQIPTQQAGFLGVEYTF